MDTGEVTVTAPATIANLGPGYDIMGMALDGPRDKLTVRLKKRGYDRISFEVGTTFAGAAAASNSISIPSDPMKNACAVAGRAVLEAAGMNHNALDMRLLKRVPSRIGMGSSGASAAAGAYAVNRLLGEPLRGSDLLRCAMEGEYAACGSRHADNVAPALFGGVIVILGYEPLKILRFEPPQGLSIVVISPSIDLGDAKTKMARDMLPVSVPLPAVVKQMGAFAALLLGVVQGDPNLLGKGVSSDVIIEPARSKLIPGFEGLKKAALNAGAYGFSISGAGPSVFALCPPNAADHVGGTVKSEFAALNIESSYGIHKCAKAGATVVP